MLLFMIDQLNKQMKKGFKFVKRTKRTKQTNRDYAWVKTKGKSNCIYLCSGNIVSGKEHQDKNRSRNTVNLNRKASINNMYIGIILRVNSVGGSAQASDIILRELELAQTENKKPVVVSMGGTAASGGYYISCNADKIIAEPSTLTGSIGVVGLVFNGTEMFNKIKVNWDTVKKGEHSDIGSFNRPGLMKKKK